MKATAQKTRHGFRPVIVHDDGWREVIALNFRTFAEACRQARGLINQRANTNLKG